MALSSARRREQMAELEHEEQQALRRAIAGAVDAVANASDVLKRTPRAFVAGYMDREWLRDDSLSHVWEKREDDPKLLETALARIARDLEAVIERLHAAENVEDDTGIADEEIAAAVRKMKETARLPAHFPSALCESLLLAMIREDPQRNEAWEARERNPAGAQALIRDAGYALQRLAHELVTMTRPTLDDGYTPADKFDMSEADWQRHLRNKYRASEAARRR